MWEAATRLDRSWMERHLAWDFVEFGYSGRTYDRAAILDAIGDDAIELPRVSLTGMVVRPLGRDAALVTYQSIQQRGRANRSSVWCRDAGRWCMMSHQATPIR